MPVPRSSAAASRASIRWRRPPARCSAGAAILIPLSLVVERPWTLAPSASSLLALLGLAVFSTALAFVIYFRLIQTLGSVGTTAQAYLRVPIGVLLSVVCPRRKPELDRLDRACLRRRRRRRDDDPAAQGCGWRMTHFAWRNGARPCCTSVDWRHPVRKTIRAGTSHERRSHRLDASRVAGAASPRRDCRPRAGLSHSPDPRRHSLFAGQRRRRVRAHRRPEHGRSSGTARSSSSPNPAPTARSPPRKSRAPRPTATRGCW